MQPFQDSTETLGDKTKGLWIWPAGESGRPGGIWQVGAGFGRPGQDLAVRGNIPNLASGITAASELRRRQRF